MPWKETSRMSARLEFVNLAQAPDANKRELCRRFGISAKTGYKWLERYAKAGAAGLADASRKPQHSPARCDDALERAVLALHETYPCWGARKLQALLPEGRRPHPSTIDAILQRHGRQVQSDEQGPRAVKRFEHPAPNLLWQMDFKGHFALTDRHAGRCHALTVLDDHSRFALCLAACADETRATVQARLVHTFRLYGLPERITADNGPPWGARHGEGLSGLEAWLIRLGVRVSHSRPYHPQTQGKDERFHRTLKCELLDRTGFHSLTACQAAFDTWRHRYNLVRPHEALSQRPPVSRYQPSGRAYPEQLPVLEYESTDRVLKVRTKGQIHIGTRHVFIGEGLAGEYVAIRTTGTDGLLAIYYGTRLVRQIDLRVTS